ATADDVIAITDLLVVIGDGQLTGNASIGLQNEQPFEATLRPERFRIELLRPLFGEGGLIESDFPPVSGRLSGEMTVRGRVAPAMVEGISGTIRSENGSVAGVRFQNASLTIASDGGVATIRRLEAVSAFGRLNASGSLGLAAPYSYAADLRFEEFDLSAIGEITAAITEAQRPDIASPAEVAPGTGTLPIDLEGLANITGNVEGALTPFVLTGDGTAGSDRLVLDANDVSTLFKRTILTTPSFNWRYNENRLTLADIAAGLGGGTLAGTAAVPLGDATAGSLDLNITDVALADFLELPARIDGVATGEIAATLSPVQADGERAATGTADLAIPALRVGRINAGDVTAQVSFTDVMFRYDVAGTLFDGPLAAQGTLSLDPSAREASAGSVSWTGGNLARASAAYSDAPSLAGRVDARIDYDLSAATKASGTIELSEVRQGTMLLTDRLAARLLWTDGELRFENTAGGYAGGSVLLSARLDLFDLTRGTIEVLLRRADAQRAVGWIPGLEPLEGTLDLRLRGRLGQLWRWEGDAEVGRGTYGPLAFSSARVPLTIDADPFRGTVRIESRRASLRAAHGRGILNVSADVGLARRISIDATFNNLDAAEVLDGDGLGDRVAGGRVSGTLTLSSRDYRTIADLEGSLIASLAGSRAQNLPIIGSVFDVARLPTGGGGNIERGTIRVFFRRGVARVEELALAGSSFRLYADGTIAMASQRLALDVVTDTSPARVDRLLAGFLLRQLVDYATPIGWLERANRFISERALYLRVTGTIERPVVRVRPFEQLGQEGVRFFLNEIAAPAGGAAVISP
ncbi:MAG: AsmA-like C-terminal region-containing protein, partial [Planctomycetota bacterium]|nr:AsmA-like C-terminal region-containing protein [Planctomycetota bacterium]